jgi:hypothetical protein
MISQAQAKDEALKDNVPPCQGCPTVMVMEQWWNGDIAQTNHRISEKDLPESHIVYNETRIRKRQNPLFHGGTKCFNCLNYGIAITNDGVKGDSKGF